MKKIFVYLLFICVLGSACFSQNSDEPESQSTSSNTIESQDLPTEQASESTANREVQNSSKDSETSPQESEKAAIDKWNIESYDLDHNTVNLQDVILSNKITIINIWGTFCGPCKVELPDLARLANDYAEQGVTIIGIATDVTNDDQEKIDLAKAIYRDANVNFTSLVNNEKLSQTVLSGIYGVPTTMLVDQEGNLITNTILGANSYQYFAEILNSALESLS